MKLRAMLARGSGKMARVAAWTSGSNDEESRAYLQSRLATLVKVIFWCFGAFLALLFGIYALYPELEPAWSTVTFATNTSGLVIVAVIWRWALERRPLSLRALNAIDGLFAGGTGAFIGFNALVATDLQPAPYLCLLFVCLVVLTRAIVVPSTGPRTAVIAGLTLLPVVVSAAAMVVTGQLPHIPPFALVLGVFSISVLVSLLAVVGSHTSYGLRMHAAVATQLGQYTLDRKIAEGGMGAVYIGHHALLRRPTAIKLLLPERVGADALDRFEREVKHTSELTHPNTIVVFDYGRSPDGVFYYAMEYLDGIDLERLVQRHGAQPAGRVIGVLAQTAGALHEAHEKGLVHRDIKPANIMLCERGAMPDVAKVLDFGLVKQIAADGVDTKQIIVGTPAYIAPETVTDPGKVTAAADIYSLGAVAYFLLAGRRMFEGKTAIEVCVQHVTVAPPPIPCDAELAALVTRCLAKSPDVRPTALELVHALRSMPVTDWSNAEARAWWSEFHTPHDDIADDPTQTITVDIAHRDRVAT